MDIREVTITVDQLESLRAGRNAYAPIPGMAPKVMLLQGGSRPMDDDQDLIVVLADGLLLQKLTSRGESRYTTTAGLVFNIRVGEAAE